MASILLIGLVLTIVVSIIAVSTVDDSNQIHSNHHYDTTEDDFHMSFQNNDEDDYDNDGIPDSIDWDDDNDGIPDTFDDDWD